MIKIENIEVAIAKCEDYSEDTIKKAMDDLIEQIGGLNWVKEGMKIAIKANLVTFLKPEAAATTHPNLILELSKRLIERGANVLVGDSPGGPYNAINLNRVYEISGMNKLKQYGIKLNDDFTHITAKFPDGISLKEFEYTAYLKEADIIINFCKLKSHGMMGMSAATKNLFGIIPGTMKPEFHFRFSEYESFANMLIDINEFLKPQFCFVDAVIGMEGNGPTSGTPKKIGAILASKSPYLLDAVCAKIIGLKKENIPTLEEAYKRKLITKEVDEIITKYNVDDFVVKDFDTMKVHKRLSFDDNSKWFGKFSKKILQSKPKVTKKECIGCSKCAQVCPVKAITMIKGKPVIDRKKCIKCFCCQEFCPKGAMKVHRTMVAKILTK